MVVELRSCEPRGGTKKKKEKKNDIKWSNQMAMGAQRERFYLMGWRCLMETALNRVLRNEQNFKR